MDDTHIGFLLILTVTLVAGCVCGFRMACGTKSPLGILNRDFVTMYAVLAYVWHMGALAAFPSFVNANGSNAFIAFPILVTVMTIIMTAVISLVSCGLFSALTWAANAYSRLMAKY